jgi:Ca2+-binding EF-hand superfamily protein
MPSLFKSKRIDWNGLYVHFDGNSNGYIERQELKLMMKSAGMEFATDAEVAFAWNIINGFKPRMN